MDLGLTGEDLTNAIAAIEGTAYHGRDAAQVAAMLARFRAALAKLRAPRAVPESATATGA